MNPIEQLRKLLSVGDMRSIGAAGELSSDLARDASLLAAAVCLMGDADPAVAMRASDAVEKATRGRSKQLTAHKEALLGLLHSSRQKEVIWHLLQIAPRLTLASAERLEAFDRAEGCLESCSRIVAAEALSAMFSLAGADADLRSSAVQAAKRAALSDAPSLRARARRLLRIGN